MSHIRIEKGLPQKPKFRQMLRMTGLTVHELVGFLFLAWRTVDEIGSELHGDDDIIAESLEVSIEVLNAMLAVGWAHRVSGGISFGTIDPTYEERSAAHRARARAQRAHGASTVAHGAHGGEHAAHDAPPSSPSIPSNPSSSSIASRARKGRGGGGDSIGDIPEGTDENATYYVRKLSRIVGASEAVRLAAMIVEWPGDRRYDRFKSILQDAAGKKSPKAWLKTVIENEGATT